MDIDKEFQQRMSQPPTAATMSQVKRIARARMRRRSEQPHTGLNIYPMMDMMTILLVFMVMQMASSFSVVQETGDLRLPKSTSTIELLGAVPIQISRNGIAVDGEQVLELQAGGLIDPNDKQGGGTGFVVVPLLKKMNDIRDLRKAIAERDPGNPFTGEAQVIADQDTPYRTLSEVLYTVGRAEFSLLRFVVHKNRDK